jgi:hypothetical protein
MVVMSPQVLERGTYCSEMAAARIHNMHNFDYMLKCLLDRKLYFFHVLSPPKIICDQGKKRAIPRTYSCNQCGHNRTFYGSQNHSPDIVTTGSSVVHALPPRQDKAGIVISPRSRDSCCTRQCSRLTLDPFFLLRFVGAARFSVSISRSSVVGSRNKMLILIFRRS